MIRLSNTRLADNRRVDIYIQDGKIARIEPIGTSCPADETIECYGYLALPGLIDSHVHFRTPGGEAKEDWPHGSQAAILGGVTTVGDMPNTNPTTTTHELFARKLSEIGQQPINYSLWFGATPTNMMEIESVASLPGLLGVKVYMGASTGDLLVSLEKDQRKVMESCAPRQLIVAVHAEDDGMLKERKSLLSQDPQPAEHCFIRFAEAEISAVKQALRLQRETGCRLYFCHISHPTSLELIHEAKMTGADIVVECCPHHIFIDWTAMDRPDGTLFQMNPPLRSPEEVKLMQYYLLQGEYIDVIGSDHAPHTMEEKLGQRYPQTPSGVPGVQTIMPMLYSLVHAGRLGLAEMVRLISGRVGEIFYGGRKGKIEIGADADLLIFDPAPLHTIRSEEMASKMEFTPFDGFESHGLIKLVMVGGQVVHSA